MKYKIGDVIIYRISDVLSMPNVTHWQNKYPQQLYNTSLTSIMDVCRSPHNIENIYGPQFMYKLFICDKGEMPGFYDAKWIEDQSIKLTGAENIFGINLVDFCLKKLKEYQLNEIIEK